MPNGVMQESAGKITHFSFTYEKVNKTDNFQPSGCKGLLVLIMATVHNSVFLSCLHMLQQNVNRGFTLLQS